MKRTIANGLALFLTLLVTSRADIDSNKTEFFRDKYNMTLKPVDRSFCCSPGGCKSTPITPGGEVSDIYMLDADVTVNATGIGPRTEQCYHVLRNGNGTFDLALGIPGSENGLCMGSMGTDGVLSTTANSTNPEQNFQCAGRCGPGCSDTNIFNIPGFKTGLNRWSTGCFRHDMCGFFTIERHWEPSKSVIRKFPFIKKFLDPIKPFTNLACGHDLKFAINSAFGPFTKFNYPNPETICVAPNGPDCAGSTQSDVCTNDPPNSVPISEPAFPFGSNLKECMNNAKEFVDVLNFVIYGYYFTQEDTDDVLTNKEMKLASKLMKQQCKLYHNGDPEHIVLLEDFYYE